ncbi:MAG: hypothetical protein M3R70_04075, partial [Actinomycetota bacterium]|nr:hypothetical protein [Actinomycetota bacterium]
RHGMTSKRLMTDNAFAYVKNRSLRELLAARGIRHLTTQPYRPHVEREFGRLKNEYGLAPLRVRGLARVQLHADLTMLARLSLALSRARAVPLAA